MIISHKHQFIFIKTRKVAGTSIEIFLRDHLGPEDIATALPREDLPAINCSESIDEHVGFEYIKEHWPNEWKDYYTFTIDRNPWDKLVSAYFYYNTYYPGHGEKSDEGFMKWASTPDRVFPNDWEKYAIQWKPQVNKAYQYERLHVWFPQLCKRLNIPYSNELKTIRAKGHCRDFEGYQHLYTDETREKVAQQFASMIKYFKYEF